MLIIIQRYRLPAYPGRTSKLRVQVNILLIKKLMIFVWFFINIQL